MIRHELPPFFPDSYHHPGGPVWPIPLPEWILWMWADYNLLIGALCIVLPILITIFLIGRERYRSGWFCLLLFTLLVFGTGLSLWLDSILMALSGW